MDKERLNELLAKECDKDLPDLGKVEELLSSGADAMLKNEYGELVVVEAMKAPFWYWQEKVKELPEGLVRKRAQKKILEIFRKVMAGEYPTTLILAFLSGVCLYIFKAEEFDFFCDILKLLPPCEKERYQALLSNVGTEESYQRVCEECHELENILYAMYEAVLAKRDGRRVESIDVYHKALGMGIDKILLFAPEKEDEKKRFCELKECTEFNADIGFVCGERLLVLRESINILFMDGMEQERPYREMPALFGETVVGETIADISFSHRQIWKGTTGYGQPTITLTLSSGVKLNFTHNFGEMEKKAHQSRFYVTQA